MHRRASNECRFTARQRRDPRSGRRRVDSSSIRAAQRPRSARPTIRLRARAVRSLYRHHRRRRDALVHHARRGGERRDHHARRSREERHVASAAAGVDRRAGAAVRLLPERPDHDRQGAARPEPEPDRRRNPRRHGRRAVPLHDVLPDSGGDQTRRARDARRRRARGGGE